MAVGRTMVLSVHVLRRTARAQERQVQHELEEREGYHVLFNDRDPIPGWVRGVRVERTGSVLPPRWVVVLTEAP